MHFRKRIGEKGFEKIFQVSVGLHGKTALEDTVNIDTTVQEKAITYPTDAKLAIKIINRLNNWLSAMVFNNVEHSPRKLKTSV